jgi:hypothetical protein
MLEFLGLRRKMEWRGKTMAVFIVEITRKDSDFVAGSMYEAKAYVHDYACIVAGSETYVVDTMDYAEFVIHGVDGERTGTIKRQ